MNRGSIYVHRPHSRDLTPNFFVVLLIEANLFNNPDDGDSIINEILVPTWLEGAWGGVVVKVLRY